MSLGAVDNLTVIGGKHTNRDNVVRVIALHRAGKKNREIARITGVNEKTVSDLLRKWRQGGGGDTVPMPKHGERKPLKIFPKTLKLIKRQLDLNPRITAKQLKEQNPRLLRGITVCTIQRIFRKD